MRVFTKRAGQVQQENGTLIDIPSQAMGFVIEDRGEFVLSRFHLADDRQVKTWTKKKNLMVDMTALDQDTVLAAVCAATEHLKDG